MKKTLIPHIVKTKQGRRVIVHATSIPEAHKSVRCDHTVFCPWSGASLEVIKGEPTTAARIVGPIL